MDGTSYEISVAAKSVGVTTSADELNRLASSLDAAAHVATSFDVAIARAEALLADASAAAQAAADAVGDGATKYRQLEVTATRAAKAVEKAAAAGKDTSALQAKADAAAAALATQGTALDELRAKSAAAAAAQKTLEGSLKSLQSAAKAEAAALKASAKGAADLAQGAEKVSAGLRPAAGAGDGAAKSLKGFADVLDDTKGAGGGMAKQLAKVVSGMGPLGLVGVAGVAVGVVASLTTAVFAGVFALAKYAVTLNKVAAERLTKINEKAKKSFVDLFSGVRVSKFVDGLERIAKGLDADTTTGRALKTLLETLLNPLFDAIPKLVPYVEQLFRGFVLGAVLAAIAALKLYIVVRKMIPDSVKTAVKDLSKDIDWMATALWSGVAVVGLLAVAFGILAAAVLVIGTVIASPFILGAIVIGLVAAAVYVAIAAFGQLKSYVMVAGDVLSQLAGAAKDAALNLVNSLVSEIKNGTGKVMQALQSLGSSAIGALKKSLGIASPSKFALEFASNVTGTFAGGIEEGAGEAQSAMATLAEPPEAAAKPGRNAASSGRGGINLSGATFHFHGVKDAEQARGLFEETLNRVLEGDVLALGGGVEAPA